MEWLSYHHLFYFWKVVRLGSITAACKWCDGAGIRPVMIGGFEDYGLLRAFGQQGAG